MLRGCIVGAGPSGLFTAKYLAQNNIPVTIYERETMPLGNYRYAIDKKIDVDKILRDKNITTRFGVDHTAIDKSNFDFYVIATGGLPRKLDIKGGDNFIPAIDVIKSLSQDKSENKPMKLGDRICIVGLGNVTLDLLWHIADKCKKAVVISKSSPDDAPFDPHVLQNLLENKNWRAVTDEMPSATTNRRARRRCDIFQKYVKKEQPEKTDEPLIQFIFNKKVTEARKLPSGEVEVTFVDKNDVKKAVFDSVISSVGFIPNKVEVDDTKPVFYTGWCVEPRGNISDSAQMARECVNQIITNFKIQS